MSFDLTRRRFLIGSSVAATGLLTGCDAMVQSTTVNDILQKAESLTMGAQRLLMSQQTLAREFSEADLSPVFKANGTSQPDSEDYARMTESNFTDWKLVVNGMVKTPLNLSLADLKAMPSRTQITRHDCVEGWSAIGKWTGVPLGLVLEKAGLAPAPAMRCSIVPMISNHHSMAVAATMKASILSMPGIRRRSLPTA